VNDFYERDRAAAIQWARNLAENDYVILDTETTGLYDAEIVQIAVIDRNGDPLLDTLVKPVNPIPADATRVHGITNDMVETSPGWESVARRLLQIISGRRVIIYNADYDIGIMYSSTATCGMEKVQFTEVATFECAMLQYACFWGDWNSYHQSYRWQKLTAACDQLRINQDEIDAPAHSALGDCLRTLELIRAMAKTKAAQS